MVVMVMTPQTAVGERPAEEHGLSSPGNWGLQGVWGQGCTVVRMRLGKVTLDAAWTMTCKGWEANGGRTSLCFQHLLGT